MNEVLDFIIANKVGVIAFLIIVSILVNFIKSIARTIIRVVIFVLIIGLLTGNISTRELSYKLNDNQAIKLANNTVMILDNRKNSGDILFSFPLDKIKNVSYKENIITIKYLDQNNKIVSTDIKLDSAGKDTIKFIENLNKIVTKLQKDVGK